MASRNRTAASRAKASAETTPATPYVPTEREKAVLADLQERQKDNNPLPHVRVTKHGKTREVGIDHPDVEIGAKLLMHGLGITRVHELVAVMDEVGNIVAAKGEIEPGEMNRAFAVLQGIGPRDSVELMLATQMLAVHRATLTATRRVRGSETLPQLEANGALLNKLMRTFTTQVETLKKYRSKGDQKVVVEHVHVYPGGQAAVGVFNGGMGADLETERQSHGTGGMLLSERAAVLSDIEAYRVPVPSASGTGQEGLPVSRGKSRRTSRKG